MSRLAWLLALGLACGGAGDGGAPPAGAPPTPRAAIVLEPPRFRVGDVARVELVVTTPPGYAVAPLRPPPAEALGPLWLLGIEALPVEEQGPRWTHRIRLRVRARAVGTGTFPALSVEVEGPEGMRRELATEPRPFEVVSVLPEFPDRLAPFSYRLPEAPAPGVAPGAAAAAGAAAALGLVAAVALLRRARRRATARRAQTAVGAAPRAPWTEALAALERAAAESESDWRGAADRTAQALRRYVARRWGWPVDRRTSEELAAAVPPLAVAMRWPAAFAWLRALDAERFRPDAAPDAPEHVRRIARSAHAWVRSSIPAEELEP